MKFPIPSDWDGESWCRWSVCWPESEQWEGFLRGLLSLPQRGRTWDERTGTITEIQQVGREITEANLPLNGVIMACNDTGIQEAFEGIALAIRYAADRQFSKPCCGDSTNVFVNNTGHAGTTFQPVGGNTIPIYGNSPPAELPPDSDLPVGFESQEEWTTHRCAVANQIFDGVVFTLQGLATLSLLNINVLGVLVLAAIPGFLAFPPAAIPIMVGALLVLVGIQATLLTVRNGLIEHRADVICILITWDSVPVIIGYLADFIDFLLALLPVVGPVALAVKTILLLLFNGDALNKLFDSSADYSYPDADCSGCTSCEEFYYEFEEGADEFGSVNNLPGCFELDLNSESVLEAFEGVLNVAISGGTPNPNGAFGRIGVDYQIGNNTNFEVTLRASGADNIYIDLILVFSDDSCLWTTMSNNHAASGEFAGLSVDLSANSGKWIDKIYIFLASATAGGDGQFLVEFEKIGFFCS
jgi:hypothetical protein